MSFEVVGKISNISTIAVGRAIRDLSRLQRLYGKGRWRFESEEDLVAAMSSPEGQKLSATLLEDEGNFIDHSKSSAFIVREHEL